MENQRNNEMNAAAHTSPCEGPAPAEKTVSAVWPASMHKEGSKGIAQKDNDKDVVVTEEAGG
jgi:hypothetical protein